MSATICISICFGFSKYFSINTEGLLNAASASDEADRYICLRSDCLRTMRIPRPPPPAEAFMITGKPIDFEISIASSSVLTLPLLPPSMGTLPLAAIFFAVILSPIFCMIRGEGPMKIIPSSVQRVANSAFSDRYPYPGWIASILFLLANSTRHSISKNSGVSFISLSGKLTMRST